MSDLSALDTEELKTRMGSIFEDLNSLFIKVGPLVKEIGILREEADIIYRELIRRGVLNMEPLEVDERQPVTK